MKNILLVISFLLLYFKSISQWNWLAQPGTNISITSENNGFSVSDPTYFCGCIHCACYDVLKTTNDFQNFYSIYTYSGSTMYCCTGYKIFGCSDSVVFDAFDNNGFLQLRQIKIGQVPTVISNSGGNLDNFNLFTLNDSTCYYAFSNSPNPYVYLHRVSGGVATYQFFSYAYSAFRKTFFTNDSLGYILSVNTSGSNHIMKTLDRGINFSTVLTTGTLSLNDEIFISDSIGYIAADSGKVFKTINGGTSWQLINVPTTKNLNSIYFINDSIGYVVGDSGTVLKTFDGGFNWFFQSIASTSKLIQVKFVSPNVGYILCADSNLFKTINGGGITSIGEEVRSATNQLIIYANPTKGTCNVTIPEEFQHEKNLTLQIFDNTGKLLQQTKVEMQQEKVKVNLEEEAKGVYNVILSNGKKSYNGKIVFE
jgi:type IX secretion system substrate protein/photosynthesis system II assembly factor YCF48-like protein